MTRRAASPPRLSLLQTGCWDVAGKPTLHMPFGVPCKTQNTHALRRGCACRCAYLFPNLGTPCADPFQGAGRRCLCTPRTSQFSRLHLMGQHFRWIVFLLGENTQQNKTRQPHPGGESPSGPGQRGRAGGTNANQRAREEQHKQQAPCLTNHVRRNAPPTLGDNASRGPKPDH